MPGFLLGFLLIGGLLYLVRFSTEKPFLPVSGFGWDAHLVLPVLALSLRPTIQIAHVTASFLTGELGKRYVVAARSFGYTWRAIRWDKAFRNVLAALILSMAGAFRQLTMELVLIEWLFDWPGIGRLLVKALVPPKISSLGGLVDTTVYFLNPSLIAALLVLFALQFLLVDLLAMSLARGVDPRLRIAEEEEFHD